ncbi:hypothetical protein BD324DRAFT_639157 [Kockovaella imperatae]|uniref:Stress-associated endoplasmic reticulum protein n=1 Tax=Kockovaella imperatae TaxID=4999 RepID=A0A1Y1U9B5_9TREE|nr:hypothetical protein BD324DRAFT_639157 [Kockovaella imperatae]ORX33685.1 hypothetical protein BD324DRAFT_639157 [Kockovaella imperatae]
MCLSHSLICQLSAIDYSIALIRTAVYTMPTAADIKRKNANFAARAQAGKRTTRPARTGQKQSLGMWMLLGIGFLLVGGTVVELVRMIFMKG